MHPKNHGKEWKKQDIQKLNSMAKRGAETDKIAKELGRKIMAIYSKASDEGISLNPRGR